MTAVKLSRDALIAKLKRKTYKKENHVKDAITLILKSYPHLKYFKYPASAYGDRGVDVIGCYRGYFFAIEAKHTQTSRKASPLQKITLSQIAASGGLAIVINELNYLKLFEVFDYVGSLPYAGVPRTSGNRCEVGLADQLNTKPTFAT